MRRAAAVALTVCLAFAASAHVVGFTFFTPAGIDGRTDGGVFTLSWTDGPDPVDTAAFTLHAGRDGTPPFRLPRADVDLDAVPRAVSNLADAFAWDARAVSPGCYQPFARMTDPEEGVTLRLSEGLVTVSPDDGGNRWPAVWVVTPSGATRSDAGTLNLRIAYDDPDDALELTIRWASPDAGGTLAAGLPIGTGRGETTYAVNPALIAAEPPWFFQAQVQSPDGRACSAWWQGALDPRIPDAGSDGGAGGGSGGAGGTGGTGGSGGGAQPPAGCSCATSPLAACVAFALLVALRRRRRT